MSTRDELIRISTERSRKQAEISKGYIDKARYPEITAKNATDEATAFVEGREYTPIELPNIAEIDAMILRNNAAIAVLDKRIEELRAEQRAEQRYAEGKMDLKRRNAIKPYRHENSHLFSFSKIADLTVREVVEIMATQKVMPTDPRIKTTIEIGKIVESDWMAVKKRAKDILEAQS